MSTLLNYTIFYILAFAPFIAFITIKFLNVGFYNMLSAFVWLAFFLQLITITSVHKKKYIIPKYALFLGLFVIYAMASDFFLADKTIDLKYFYTNHYISGLLLMLIIENTLMSKKLITSLFKINIVILIIAFIVMLYQQVFNDTFFVDIARDNVANFIFNADIYEKRMPSIYSWLDLFEVAFSFVAIAGIIISIRLLKKRKNHITLIWFAIVFIYAFLAKFRWIMLNALILLLMYAIYLKFNIKKILSNILIGLLVFIASFSLLESYNIPVTKIFQERVLETKRGGLAQGSAGTRILAFYVFYKLFPEHPILGKGYIHDFSGDSKDHELVNAIGGRSSQIHVGYLSLFYYYGIIGGGIFILFLYHLMKKLKKDAKQTHFWGAYFAYLGFVLANLTLVTFTVFWVGLNMALIFNRYYVLRLKNTIKPVMLSGVETSHPDI